MTRSSAFDRFLSMSDNSAGATKQDIQIIKQDIKMLSDTNKKDIQMLIEANKQLFEANKQDI